MCKILIITLCILVFIFWLGCSISPLGKVINKKISKSYYYNKSKTKIIYCSGGSWFGSSHAIIEEADINTFQPIAESAGKDAFFVFYQSTKQINVDLSSFKIENGVMKDANHVYHIGYENVITNPLLKPIPFANPKTYKELGNDYVWAKDDKNYFYRDKPVLGIDYASFCIVNRNFFYDKDSIYVIPSDYYTAIKEDFRLLAVQKTTGNIKRINESFIQSNNQIYFVFGESALYENPELKDIDKRFKTFVFDAINYVEEIDELMIKVNNKNILYNGNYYPIKNVDVPTFKKLDPYYSKDKNQVYYKDTILIGADAETFEVMNDDDNYVFSRSKDKNYVYFNNVQIKGSNPKLFHYDKKAQQWTDGTYYYYGERLVKIE